MAFRPQPVYGPDYGRILSNALGAYQTTRAIEMDEAQVARSKQNEKEMKELSRRASLGDQRAIDQLAVYNPQLATYLMNKQRTLAQRQQGAQRQVEVQGLISKEIKTPEEMARLYMLNPDAAKGYEAQRKYQREQAAAEAEKQSAMGEKTERELAIIARNSKGRPTEQKLKIIQNGIKRIQEKGGDPKYAIAIHSLLSNESSEDDWQADAMLSQIDLYGVSKGYLKEEKKAEQPIWAVKVLKERGIEKGDPRYIPELVKLTTKGGYKVEVGADGGVVFTSGVVGAGAVPVSKSIASKLQGKQADNMAAIAGMNYSVKKLDKNYLTIPSRLKAFVAEGKELAGMKLDEKDQKWLQDYSNFKGSSLLSLSLFLNALSGAAISPQEAKRLEGAYPNPKDSYSVFMGKYNSVKDMLLLRNRIYNDLVREGFKGDTVREVQARMAADYQPSAEGRIEDLKKAGKNEDEMYQILAAEGYI